MIHAEENVLLQLNQEYVDAYMNADVDWFAIHLDDDFVCIESDGWILNKEEFSSDAENTPDIVDYKLHDVDVRVYGDVALVRAAGIWMREDGSMGMSRYTDVYVRRNGEWKVVPAQITRTSRMGRPRGRYKRPKVA
jgi:ketosteroid isomerase-like protein